MLAKGGILLRTRSARGRTGVNDFNGQDGISSPSFNSTDAKPRDDLFIISSRQSPERKCSPSRPRTACSPSRQTSKTKPVVPIQKDQQSSHGLALPNVPQQHVMYSTSGPEGMYIGMALGSPSQNRLPPLPLQVENTAPFVGNPSVFADQNVPGSGDLLRQKGRWKMFGGLFGKKSSSTPVSPGSSFYQLHNTQSPGASNQDSGTSRHYNGPYRDMKSSRNTNSPSKPTETGRNSPKKLQAQRKKDNKPNVKRSHTMPMLRGERRSPTPPPKDDASYRNPICSQADGEPMLLQVEIPNVAMERYSIMFGNVLQPKQPPLLVRRQAQLEKLKTKMAEEEVVRLLF